MNVVGSRPDGWWRDRERAMRRLVEQVVAYQRVTGDVLTIVFDGDARPGVAAPAEGLEVVFASAAGFEAADDKIVQEVAGDPAPAWFRVVTSDKQLAERVRRAGGEVVSSGSFLRLLERSASDDAQT